MRVLRPAFRAAVLFVVTAACFPVAPAAAQDGEIPVEVLIFNNFTDTPLADALGLVFLPHGFDVTVDEGGALTVRLRP